MALPNSRNTTYVASSEVFSADLNDIQDGIVDHESRLDDLEADAATQDTRLDDLEAAETVVLNANVGYDHGTDWARSSGHVDATDATPSLFDIPIAVKQGHKLTVTARVKHTAATAASMVAVLWRDLDGTPTQVATVDSIASALAQTLAVVADHVIVAGESYWLGITYGGAGGAMTRTVYKITVTQVPV